MKQNYQSEFSVGNFVCHMKYSTRSGLQSEWSPKVPSDLSIEAFEQYRSGRDAFLRLVSADLGVSVVVIE